LAYDNLQVSDAANTVNKIESESSVFESKFGSTGSKTEFTDFSVQV